MTVAIQGLSQPVVLVTGGGRGLGAAIARRFADDDAIVIVADLEKPVQDDPRIRFEQADVSDAEEVALLFSRLTHEHSRLDTLVNNAGVWFRRPFAEISADEWDHVLGVNLRGVFLCTQAALEPMRTRGGGSVINIGSQAGSVALAPVPMMVPISPSRSVGSVGGS